MNKMSGKSFVRKEIEKAMKKAAADRKKELAKIEKQLDQVEEKVHTTQKEIKAAKAHKTRLGSKSRRPKSQKTCKKRHMKWKASTKRCNKSTRRA
jgi:hypothetical protein